MSCPLCRSRKERRFCPAVQQTICPVCCGTKRLTEIQCPDDCAYLSSAREHPAATVKRQQEHDVAMLLPTLRGLSERQHQLFFLFQSLIARHTPEGFARLVESGRWQQRGAETAAKFDGSMNQVVGKNLNRSPGHQSIPSRKGTAPAIAQNCSA